MYSKRIVFENVAVVRVPGAAYVKILPWHLCLSTLELNMLLWRSASHIGFGHDAVALILGTQDFDMSLWHGFRAHQI